MTTVLVVGCGAIGSRLEAHADPALALVFADNQRVLPENLGIAAFAEGDLFQEKAEVLAARRRGRGGVACALAGDVRYALRPGLARALAAAVLCLDNPSALRDAAEALWEAGPGELPVLVLTCGAGSEHQVRLFVRPGPCPVCLFGTAERHADRLAQGVSCVDTTAPRASAAAAEAAAEAGAAVLARWLAGDRTLANCRLQHDAGPGAAYVIRMPAAASPHCPVAHGGACERAEHLGGTVSAVAVGALAERALARAGDDAAFVLGRRGVPLGGLYCPRCRAMAPAPLLLLPAARAVRFCGCGEAPRPLAERSTIAARELLAPAVASLTLARWGAGHGDEFLVTGRRGRVRLCCAFDWSDMDAA
jgi:hypothetical protein